MKNERGHLKLIGPGDTEAHRTSNETCRPLRYNPTRTNPTGSFEPASAYPVSKAMDLDRNVMPNKSKSTMIGLTSRGYGCDSNNALLTKVTQSPPSDEELER